MNEISIIGGTKSQKALVYKIVAWYLKKVLPRVRTLDITVKLTRCMEKSNAMGYCLELDDHKTFEIELDKNLRLYDTVSTLCHELTHLRQYYRKEMVNLNYGRVRWKKKTYKESLSYEKRPWEKEAFKIETQLAIDCFTEML